MTDNTTWLLRGAAAAFIGPFLPWLFITDYVARQGPHGFTSAHRTIVGITDGISSPIGIAVLCLAATALIVIIIDRSARDPRCLTATTLCAFLMLTLTVLGTIIIPIMLSTGEGPHMGALLTSAGSTTILITIRRQLAAS